MVFISVLTWLFLAADFAADLDADLDADHDADHATADADLAAESVADHAVDLAVADHAADAADHPTADHAADIAADHAVDLAVSSSFFVASPLANRSATFTASIDLGSGLGTKDKTSLAQLTAKSLKVLALSISSLSTTHNLSSAAAASYAKTSKAVPDQLSGIVLSSSTL